RVADGEFGLTLFPQATAQTATYSFTAIAPDGYALEDLENGGKRVERLHEDGALDGAVPFRLRVVED
ncbi:MAG TPA: hypothetical protein VIG64_13865, partial [Actinomycetota bacterium]